MAQQLPLPSSYEEGAIIFKLYNKAAIKYLQSPLLVDSGLLDHGFSTRQGGCSKGPVASLNTAFHTEDYFENVLENRRRFFGVFNYDYRKITSAIQVHKTEIAIMDLADRGNGALPGSARQKCDALVTTERGLPVAAYAADCLLIYVVSTGRPLVALAHAGWRGTLDQMGPKLVRFIKQQYGLQPEQLLVSLSPAICSDCYRVDHDTAMKFFAAGWKEPLYMQSKEDGTYKLDLKAINREQLYSSGIKIKNLDYSSLCTSCHEELFYSYRRDQGHTGRMIGFAALKD